MLVWEAHRALANAIGDTAAIDATLISDGVRFPRTLRDSYLYRGMLKIYEQAISAVVQLPWKQKSMVLEQVFPNSIVEIDSLIDLRAQDTTYGDIYVIRPGEPILNVNILQIIGCRCQDAGLNSWMPLPIKSSIESTSLMSSHITHKADPFLEFYFSNSTLTNFRIVDMRQLLIATDVKIKYLPYPDNPSNQGILDTLMIDDKFTPKVITNAIFLAKMESQELASDEYLIRELSK